MISLFWIISASALGFAAAAIFAGLLKLPRNIFLLFYIPLAGGLVTLFLFKNNFNILYLFTHNWYWGIAGAVIAGAFVLKNVYSQPSSKRSSGWILINDIFWPGLIYGMTDALLLSVLPVLAVQIALTAPFWSEFWYGRVALGAIALLASLIVTTAYHLGYPEFRSKKVIYPNVGNGVLSLAFIITMNPIAAILPHMAMHVAAMIHGKETTGQVPPHYDN
jgi:hypothetical protein